MNVIGSRPTGWWRDRDEALRGLMRRLAALSALERIDITVVADGHPLSDLPEGVHDGVQLLYATRRGPDAADDRIIEFVDSQPDPHALEVITSDRDLAARARACRARVRGPRALLEQLDSMEVE